MISENKYPYVKNSIIEKESLKLLNTFFKNKEFKAPIPVFDIIEFLGYNIEFKKNGIYSDNSILGGLRVKDKIVEINPSTVSFVSPVGIVPNICWLSESE